MTHASYTAPAVTVVPVNKDWTPGNHHHGKQQFTQGGYSRPDIFVILNLRTGQLTARNGFPAFDKDLAGRAHWRGPGWYDPSADLWVRGHGWGRTPIRLAWTGNNSKYVQDAAGVNEHLEQIRPIAQQLVDALEPVPGTNGDYDWTLRATAIDSAINGLVDYGAGHGPTAIRDRVSEGTITFAELIEADPDLIDPLWATMTDTQLDEVARLWTGDGDRHGKFVNRETENRLCAHFDLAGWKNGVAPEGVHSRPSFYVLHARTDLRRWRDTAIATATGLPTAYAEQVFDGYDGDDLSASCTDADLDQIAARLEATVAYRDKVAVIGTRGMLLKQRAQMRARVRREAQAAGAAVVELEGQLRTARATRDGLLSQVVGFGEEPEHNTDGTLNYAEIARVGSMSRVAARNKFRDVDGDLVLDEPDTAAA